MISTACKNSSSTFNAEIKTLKHQKFETKAEDYELK